MTLSEFLLARIAEDEAMAQTWPESEPSLAPDGHLWRDTSGRAIYAPRSRVLADCEARRRIVDLRDQAARAASDPPEGSGLLTVSRTSALNDALRLLATVYADHADYRDGWR